MKEKKTIILCSIIGVLLVAVGTLSVLLLKKDKEPAGQEADTVTEELTSEEAGGEDTSEEDSDGKEADSEEKALFYADIKAENTWENGTDNCATESVIIYNNSENTVTSWKLTIEYASDIKLDGIWNGEGEAEGSTLTVTPEDYNQEIAPNGNIDFGFNLSGADITVNDYVLYINGKEYRGSELALADTSDGAEATTETTTETVKTEPEDGTLVQNHGALSVLGTNIVDEAGNPYQLKGCSTHGITWFPEYVNYDAFKTFRDDYGVNLIRLAMYTDTGDSKGYCSGGDQDYIKGLIGTGVDAATELGMYVIIDWHILNDNNPNTYVDEAKEFFDEMSDKYKDYDNVLYEICNEPNGDTTWSDVKAYAEEVIPVIRANDENAIIIVGTPTWSQDVDVAAKDPITGYDNIVYTVHFYAATHKEDLRNKVQTALDSGLPIFVSEFSICDASGNGSIDYTQADVWFDLINENNLSYAAWNISNKAETSSLISSSCNKTSGWTSEDLSEAGTYILGKISGN